MAGERFALVRADGPRAGAILALRPALDQLAVIALVYTLAGEQVRALDPSGAEVPLPGYEPAPAPAESFRDAARELFDAERDADLAARRLDRALEREHAARRRYRAELARERSGS